AFKAHDKGGQRVYEARGGDKDAPSAFACVLDKGTVVVGPSSASVLDAAARHAGKKTSQIDKELAGLLTKADTTQVLWAAGVGSKELRKELEQFPEARGFAGSVRSFAGGVSVTNGLRADFRVTTTNRRAATEVARFAESWRLPLSLFAVASKDHGPLLAGLLGPTRGTSPDGVAPVEAGVTAAPVKRLRGPAPEKPPPPPKPGPTERSCMTSAPLPSP